MNFPYSTSSRPTILTFVRHYLPGYKSGGPIRTVANLVEALGDEFHFRIVTSDRDATDSVPYPGIDQGVWKKVGKADVLYLASGEKKSVQIARILSKTRHDVLYLNSFFDPDFTFKPLLVRQLGLAPRTRCIIAPRGEFSEGALKIKAGRKKGYLYVVGMSGLYSHLTWHASSEHERADINRVQGNVAKHITIATNLPDTRGNRQSTYVPRTPDEPLRVGFLSRISPMKNLDYALEVLQRVNVPVQFDIYGPVRDNEYWAKCKRLIHELPAWAKAAYLGSVEHADVEKTLSRYDLFFLPTRGENFGHIILESLSVGTPVLIADTTPWRSLSEHGIGWELTLDNPGAFAAKIDHMARITLSEMLQMRAQALSFSEQRRKDADAVQKNRTLFRQAMV